MSSSANGTEAGKPTLLVLTSTYPRWTDDPEPGFVHELAKRLTGRFRVIVLGPHASGAKTAEVLDGVEVVRYRYAPERLETLVNDGGIVTNLRRHKWKHLLVPGFVLAQAWHAWRLVRTGHVTIIHAHWLIPQGLLAAMLRCLPGRKAPFVATSHGADLFALQGRLLQRMKRFVIDSACAVTVVSEAMRERIRDIDPDTARVSVQPMGVDLRHRFVPDPDTARSDDELLFVGRLVEKKGLRHLLDAMPAVIARRPGVRLRIAGFGPEEAALKHRIESLGLADQVDFLGAVPQIDLPGLYRRAALFVAPFVEAGSGDQEGLGLVLVEAAGCGCPVLAGDVRAVRDVLGHASKSLVDPREQAQLANAIVSVLENPQRARADAKALREGLIDKFDWQNVADDYAQILAACSAGLAPARYSSTTRRDASR
ncbi:MAG TPA: glycosyltransferase [Luteimonas sp.]|nr:glycosyltransferase [Luteimonas sp.]